MLLVLFCLETRNRKTKPIGEWVCSRCGKTYIQNGNLMRHMKYECGVERKFSCLLCPYHAHRNDNLKKHMLMKHQYLLWNEIIIFSNWNKYSSFLKSTDVIIVLYYHIHFYEYEFPNVFFICNFPIHYCRFVVEIEKGICV